MNRYKIALTIAGSDPSGGAIGRVNIPPHF